MLFSLFRIHRPLRLSLLRSLPRFNSFSVLFFRLSLLLSSSIPSRRSIRASSKVCGIRYHLITILEQEQTLLSTTFRQQERRDCFFFCCLFTSVTFNGLSIRTLRTFKRLGVWYNGSCIREIELNFCAQYNNLMNANIFN